MKPKKYIIPLIPLSALVLIFFFLGWVFLKGQDKGPSGAFQALAFIISAVALIMTTLQSVLIRKQMIETRKNTKIMSDAANQITSLLVNDEEQTEIMNQDLELDKILIDVLTGHGLHNDKVLLNTLRSKIKKHKNFK